MASYQLIFPDYLEGYEHETESKGYLVGVKVLYEKTAISLVFYDPTRLAQEIGDELRSSGYFAEARLVVVSRVTRAEISHAVERMSANGFQEVR